MTLRLRTSGYWLPVALDVIEHQPLAQREIAQRDLGRAQPPQHGVEQDRAGDDEIGAARVEAGQLHALADAAIDNLFAKAVNLLGRDAQVANLVARTPALGGRDRPEAENRSGRANHAVESGALDVAQVFRELVLDMPDELAFVAPGQRVRVDESLGKPDDTKFEAFRSTKRVARAVGDFDAAAADIDNHR